MQVFLQPCTFANWILKSAGCAWHSNWMCFGTKKPCSWRTEFWNLQAVLGTTHECAWHKKNLFGSWKVPMLVSRSVQTQNWIILYLRIVQSQLLPKSWIHPYIDRPVDELLCSLNIFSNRTPQNTPRPAPMDSQFQIINAATLEENDVLFRLCHA